MEFLYEYGLFLAKAITLVAAILLAVGGVVGVAARQRQPKGELEILSLSEHLDDVAEQAESLILSKEELKAKEKQQKQEEKQKRKQDKKDKEGKEERRPNLFVIDFDGSMDAHEVEGLREEVTAILSVAQDKDEVLVRLESGGGVVHGYGLAASQLQRIKDKGIPLTIAVDKVAASGGYMMACVADKVLSARFAIIGSIGVIAQMPNFHKLLKKHDIEFEQHTAGDFKRTITMFGENNQQGRDKFKQELEEVHQMFKGFVSEHRPELDIDRVATGEYWYGSRAKELGLVDEIQTSDDFLMNQNKDKQIFAVKFQGKQNLAEKLGLAVSSGISRGLMSLWKKAQTLV